VALFDRLRQWMRGEKVRPAARRAESRQEPSNQATKDLEQFAGSRRGVEAFLEPRTALYSTTLLLVADDGEYLRRPLASPDAARSFCTRLEVPLYDAAKVGYPKRMRDYDLGERPKPVDLSELPPWPGSEDTPGAVDDGPPPPPQN
jgi:hypothetical protein